MLYRYDRDSADGRLLLYIRDGTQLNFGNTILKLTLKMCQLKSICEKESGCSMTLTICIKTKFQIT